ncbi:MAG: UDP-2,3-diacylglucosamine diphosphatase [Planctomycetota bacterium]
MKSSTDNSERSDFFISDLHLDEKPDHARDLFFAFLERMRPRMRALYVLGDFFEYWLNDRHGRLDGYAPVVGALRQLSRSGVEVTFLHGNRDFMLGRKFAKDIGGHVHEDPWPVELGDKKVLLTHGDLLCTRDVSYQKARRVLRFPLVRALLRCIPIRLGRKIASEMRRVSRRENTRKARDPAIMDTVPSEILRRFEDGADVIVHGHVHRLRAQRWPCQGRDCELYVLGSWEKHGSYLEHRAGRFELHTFVPNGDDALLPLKDAPGHATPT